MVYKLYLDDFQIVIDGKKIITTIASRDSPYIIARTVALLVHPCSTIFICVYVSMCVRVCVYTYTHARAIVLSYASIFF